MAGLHSLGDEVILDHKNIPRNSTGSSGGVAATASTSSAVESGGGIINKTVITLVDQVVVLADEAGVVGYGSVQLYDFPAGAIKTIGATADVAVTKTSAGVDATWAGDFGLGTTLATNNNTLATTEQNIIPTTATAAAVAGLGAVAAQSTAAEDTVKDGTTTAASVFYNVLIDDGDQDITGTACNFILNGTITLHWINLGDY